jgi:hypothetical protein
MPEFESRLDVMLVKPLVIDRETFAESRSGELAFLGLLSAMQAHKRRTISRTMLFVGQSDSALPIVKGSYLIRSTRFKEKGKLSYLSGRIDVTPENIHNRITSLLSWVSSKDDSTNFR